MNQRIEYSHRSIQTANRYCIPRRIAGLLFGFVWAGSLCKGREEIKESRVDQPCAARAENRHTKDELDIYRLIANRSEKRVLANAHCTELLFVAKEPT